MNKVRKFFGLGRKPKKMGKRKENIELPDNFIFGSTDQKTSIGDLKKSNTIDKHQKTKTLR